VCRPGNQQREETVTAVATTTIRLDSGGGEEIITETDTATFNTVDLMAAQMAALITANVNVDITGSYTSGDKFTWEADVAGTALTRNATDANLTGTGVELRKNAFAITDVVGGTIVESAHVQ